MTAKTIIGAFLLLIAIVLSIFTGGVALPFMLPVGVFGLKYMGVPIE